MSNRQNRVPQLEPEWRAALAGEFEQDYMQELREFLRQRLAAGARIYPQGENYFNAFNRTPLSEVKVVILGQDPYHGPGQAHGLCFSVPRGVQPPPSLLNIYKELHRDLGLKIPRAQSCLEGWAAQGVFLLNSVLTVEEAKAGAHQGKGWEQFTDRVIAILNERREHLVFLLWGSYAQKKAAFVDRSRHCVLEAPHPSPLSAHRGFLGCGHFSKANEYLKQQGQQPIDWARLD
ncbi:MAG TPA: uracil-DNA glycosylase [Gammaproteobacteria bacterium]|nr:uracil-DNA glycosylase [Gammaproteobacteria bacterium]